MADTENREDQKISECLREAFGYSDDQLLKQLDQANETFKDVNFTGAEDRLMKRFLARKAELEKETASQTPTLVPQNESANIQIAEELPKKTVTVISEAEEKKKNEKKVIRFGKKKVLATAALVAVIAGGLPMMRISYNKLWKMLIDKGMKKSDLREKSGISSASLAKLGKGENITTDVLLRICEVMDCRIEDILETIRE